MKEVCGIKVSLAMFYFKKGAGIDDLASIFDICREDAEKLFYACSRGLCA